MWHLEHRFNRGKVGKRVIAIEVFIILGNENERGEKNMRGACLCVSKTCVFYIANSIVSAYIGNATTLLSAARGC
jgi:hypothetical protein